MVKNERFEALIQQIEVKFGRGASSNWKNRDFEYLNLEIQNKTKIIISVPTLKRIFGKARTADDYLPQKATIKALEQYADFQSIQPVSPANKDLMKKITRKKILALLFVAILLMGLGIVYYFTEPHTSQNNSFNTGQIAFIKSEGFNPKTGYFEYTTPNNKDSFQIQFDEAYSPIPISNGKKKISYFFQYPGLFHVRMLNKDKVVSNTIPILVETKGWQTLGYYFDQKYNQRFYPIPLKKSTCNSIFHPIPFDLNASGMDTCKILVLRLDNFHSTGTIGNNFTLETTIKNTDHWIGVRCNSIYLCVVGRNGYIQFRFTNPGCSYWIDYHLSEKTINNNEEDLTNFAFDLSNWQNIRIENRDKHIKLFINNVNRFSNSYKKSIGEIVGVSIIFHGNGYVKKYQLTNHNGTPLFIF